MHRRVSRSVERHVNFDVTADFRSIGQAAAPGAGLIAGAASQASPLANLNLEERVIGVFMTPPEVLLLLAPIHSVEIAIIPMLLLDIGVVSTIFVGVPGVVIAAAFIVIALFMTVSVVRSRDGSTDQGGAEHQSTQNYESMHIVILMGDNGISLAVRRDRPAQDLRKNFARGH